MSAEDRADAVAEAELVKRLRSGEQETSEEAARLLFQEHFERLVAGLRRDFRRMALADLEEVASDALMRLFERPERFNAGVASLHTYLRVIATNLARDRLRQDSRVMRRLLRPLDLWQAAPGEFAPRVDLTQLRDTLMRAIRDLPPAGRAAAELQMEGLTPTEIAAELGCAPGTIRTRLSRATAQLRASLARVVGPEPP